MNTLTERLDIEIEALRKRLARVEQMREKLVAYSPALEGTTLASKLSLTGSAGIDFDNPDRAEVELALKTFHAGKWTKEAAISAPGSINYIAENFFGEGQNLRLWCAAPPPTCRVEYEDVYVPARTERRAKLVCKETAIETEPVTEQVPQGEAVPS